MRELLTLNAAAASPEALFLVMLTAGAGSLPPVVHRVGIGPRVDDCSGLQVSTLLLVVRAAMWVPPPCSHGTGRRPRQPRAATGGDRPVRGTERTEKRMIIFAPGSCSWSSDV